MAMKGYLMQMQPFSVNDGDGSGTYHYGDQVQVTAKDSNNGVPFSHWTIDKGTLEISDLTVQNLTFAMPAEEVAMTAHYAQEKLHPEGGRRKRQRHVRCRKHRHDHCRRDGCLRRSFCQMGSDGRFP